MKKTALLGLVLLFTSTLFAQVGKKNKNNFFDQQTSGAIVLPAPAPTSPAKEKKDFSSDLLQMLRVKSRDSVQFYMGGKALIIRGTDTVDAFRTRVNVVGDVSVVDKIIQINPDVAGTFWRVDRDGTMWVTFNVMEVGFLPGDTISLPFRQNGGGSTAYTLKGNGECTAQGNASSKILPCQRFLYNGEDFLIYSGASSIPLKVVVENVKERVVIKDRRVNNGGNVTPAAAQQPQQQFDVFKVPAIE